MLVPCTDSTTFNSCTRSTMGCHCFSAKFRGHNISITTLLFPRRLQLSCTRKLTGNNYSLMFFILPLHFGFSKLFRSYRKQFVKAFSRGAKQIRVLREFRCPPVKCFAHTGQSTQAHSVGRQPSKFEPTYMSVSNIAALPNDWTEGDTLEINSSNGQEIHRIRAGHGCQGWKLTEITH